MDDTSERPALQFSLGQVFKAVAVVALLLGAFRTGGIGGAFAVGAFVAGLIFRAKAGRATNDMELAYLIAASLAAFALAATFGLALLASMIWSK